MIKALDVIRDEYLSNIKVDFCTSSLNKEIVYMDAADFALCQECYFLYKRSNKIMRIRRAPRRVKMTDHLGNSLNPILIE